MRRAVIYDCEYLTAEGAQRRFWNGPSDPDPLVVQIGAVTLSLEGDFAIGPRFEGLVRPLDRQGRPVTPDPFFTRLTGLDARRIAAEGRPLGEVLAAFDAFSGGADFWSWGKDELNMMG